MSNVTVFCFLASYLVAFGLEMARWVRRVSINRVVMLVAATAGMVAHTLYLFNRSGETGMPPLLSSTHDWMLVLAWLVVATYLFLTAVDRKLPLGVFLLPLVIFLIVMAYFVSDSPHINISPDSSAAKELAYRGWIMLHATLLVFGITGVVVGFVLSVMYLYQHRRLKQHHTMANDLALPSLEKLAKLNRWSVIISVPLLTLGMLFGVFVGLLSRKGSNPISFVDPVVIGNGIVWLVMLVFFIWLLATRRPLGKQVAWTTIWAGGFLLVTVVSLQVLTGGLKALSSFHS